MNKSKITALTAIATVMSASAAYADLSLAGAMAGHVKSGDGTTGTNHGVSTSSIYVSYSGTLDNGMGMATNVDINPGYTSSSGAHDSSPVNYLMTMSSDLGSVFFGTDFASAVDNNDYAQGAARYQTNGQIISSGWVDGDTASGNGIGVSTSVGPASVQATYGSGSDRAMSIAAQS